MKSEQNLISKIKALSPQQATQVEDFVEFLVAKARKRSAMERLLAIAPALEDAGATPIGEAEIEAEVGAVRAQHRASRQSQSPGSNPGADRS